jgi:hypothetical protein
MDCNRIKKNGDTDNLYPAMASSSRRTVDEMIQNRFEAHLDEALVGKASLFIIVISEGSVERWIILPIRSTCRL